MSLQDAQQDNYEKTAIPSSLVRFYKNMKKIKKCMKGNDIVIDIDITKYQLIGTLKLLKLKNESINEKGKYEVKFSSKTYDVCKRLENYMKYGSIDRLDIEDIVEHNEYFNCICKQKLQRAYIIKHIVHKYELIVGVCCYKALRSDKDKTNETLCAICDTQLKNKKI